jgi:hypothetical protein
MDEEDPMVRRFAHLFPHERKALLAALRRDANDQLDRAETDPANAGCHHYNHRMNLRILEALAPGEFDCRPGERCNPRPDQCS